MNMRGVDNVLLYVHIGDSNQGGPVAKPGGWDTKYDTSNMYVYYKDNRTSADDGLWRLYSDIAAPYVSRYPGVQAVAGNVGPDQAFIYALDQDTTVKRKKRYIKVAVGGSTLLTKSGADNDWNPATSVEIFNAFTIYFTRLGLSKLPAENLRNPQFAGVVVRLGTNDCATGAFNQANFTAAVPAFCTALRATLGPVPIYWVQIRSDLGSASGFDATSVSQARTILSNCQSGGSTPISGFTLLNYDSDTVQADGVHFDAPSFLRQGAEEAAALIALGG